MNPTDQVAIELVEASQVGAARRAATALAREAGLGEVDGGRVALVVTELATNLCRHAQRGLMFLRVVTDTTGRGVEVVAIDRGPGIASVETCMVDGFTTAGSPGTGLGAARRASTSFDAHSIPTVGSVFTARVLPIDRTGDPKPRDPFRWSAVSQPIHGEQVCGDSFATMTRGDDELFVVADGLGHGPLAASAANLAIGTLNATDSSSPARILEAAHERLRGSRGAAVAVGCVSRSTGAMRYAGIGNIAGRIVDGTASRGLVTLNGTVGVQIPKARDFDYVLPPKALLVIHSDGLTSRWDLTKDAGLQMRDPAVIAGTLFRDHARGNDDVTVLVGQRTDRPEPR